jgi:hypothetical protein
MTCWERGFPRPYDGSREIHYSCCRNNSNSHDSRGPHCRYEGSTDHYSSPSSGGDGKRPSSDAEGDDSPTSTYTFHSRIARGGRHDRLHQGRWLYGAAYR